MVLSTLAVLVLSSALPGVTSGGARGFSNSNPPRAESGAPASGPHSSCAAVHPAESLPVRATERTRLLECAQLEGRAATPHSSGGGTWSSFGVSPPGFLPYGFEMAYDAADGYVVLLGTVPSPYNSSAPDSSSETWIFQAGNWTQLAPPDSPEYCIGSSLAYDPADGYVVYFGGANLVPGINCTSSGTTWSFHAGLWTNQTVPGGPAARSSAALAAVGSTGGLVLFGGMSKTCPSETCGDTWSYLAGTWTQLHPTLSPSNRSGAGFTYDAAGGYDLLFGGSLANGAMVNDTWTYGGGTWVNLSLGHSPPEPFPDALSYDGTDQEAIFTSGANFSHPSDEEVWAFAGGAWSVLSSGFNAPNGTVPPERLGEATTYDAADGYLLLFGGTLGNLQPATDTWSFRAGGWTQLSYAEPGARTGAAMTYDGADRFVLLFGGYGCSAANGTCANPSLLNDTWEYAGGHWSEISPSPNPPARQGAGLAYDAADGYVVLFGGSDASGNLGDTWEFVGGRWSELTPARAPPGTSGPGAALTNDPSAGYVFLFEGPDVDWAFHGGNWTNLSTSSSPVQPGVPTSGPAYDAAASGVLLFGVYVRQPSPYADTLAGETWLFSNGNWTNLTSSDGAATPPAGTQAALASDPATRGVLLFGGACYSCSPDSPAAAYRDTWEYGASGWVNASVNGGPPGRWAAGLAADPPDGSVILFGGATYEQPYQYPYTAVLGDSWLWNGTGSLSRLTIGGLAATPNPVDAGHPFDLATSVSGGAPPYSYQYSGLPSPCVSVNLSLLSCVPTSAGSYPIAVTVNDIGGNSTTASVTVDVHSGLGIAAFTATPASLTVGTRSLLEANVSGGAVPYEYAYTGLPSGCTTESVALLPCVPSEVGNFTVEVTVNDSGGSSVNASLSLSVTPAGSSGGPILRSFVAAPAQLVLGNVTTLTVQATESGTTLRYLYAGLPPGCVGNNSAILSCLPASSGEYSVTVVVSDSSGRTAESNLTLVVTPAGGGGLPKVAEFLATPDVIVLGNATLLVVRLVGGGEVTFNYSSLPAGCQSANTSQLQCLPTVAGRYTVYVSVRGTAGNTTVVPTGLTVLTASSKPVVTPPTMVESSSTLPWILTGFLAVVAATLGVAWLASRRRGRQWRSEGEEWIRELRENPPPSNGGPFQ